MTSMLFGCFGFTVGRQYVAEKWVYIIARCLTYMFVLTKRGAIVPTESKCNILSIDMPQSSSEDVLGPLASLRCLPVDVLIRYLDVASLAVDAARSMLVL